MTVTADTWQARAALCELLALSFRYPDDVLVGAIASGEWGEAAEEIAGALGLAWPADGAPGAAEAAAVDDPDELKHALRAEATRLFVGAPTPVCSPYEGVWRAADDGVQALLFVNPHSMDVERFCKACGLGRPEGTNEPLDHVATECELLQFLAALTSGAEMPEDIQVTVDDLPEGSPEGAYDQFLLTHVNIWMPRFAEKVIAEARVPFYTAAGQYLKAILDLAK